MVQPQRQEHQQDDPEGLQDLEQGVGGEIDGDSAAGRQQCPENARFPAAAEPGAESRQIHGDPAQQGLRQRQQPDSAENPAQRQKDRIIKRLIVEILRKIAAQDAVRQIQIRFHIGDR